MQDLHRHLPGDVDQATVAALIDRAPPPIRRCPGILLQLPTPKHLDSDALIARDPGGEGRRRAHPSDRRVARAGSAGLGRARRWGHALLDAYGVAIRGRGGGRGRAIEPRRQADGRCCWRENATVTICHTGTRDLAAVCRRADVLVAAVGRAGCRRRLGQARRDGIDVGINRGGRTACAATSIRGRGRVAGAITPVPGGVGPMTIAMLLANTLTAATVQQGIGD